MKSRLFNFSFLPGEKVAGMAGPGRISQAVEHLVARGIRGLVSLTTEVPDTAALERAQIDHLHLPVRDFCAPTLEQAERLVEFINYVLSADENAAAVIHCRAGYGRTGTMLACWLVSKGTGAREAMETVRRVRPGSIETPVQEGLVRQFEKHWQRKEEKE